MNEETKEKIKQMGRDYFSSKENPLCIPTHDDEFMKVFRPYHASFDTPEDKRLATRIYTESWRDGYNEARYAASREGRAIELLGRIISEGSDINPQTWSKAGEFLKEIGWKP